MPPETVMGPELKATPTSPVVTAAHVTESGGLMVMAQAVPVAPVASVTWTVNEPAEVGVPVTAPVAAFRLRPPGSVPTME